MGSSGLRSGYLVADGCGLLLLATSCWH